MKTFHEYLEPYGSYLINKELYVCKLSLKMVPIVLSDQFFQLHGRAIDSRKHEAPSTIYGWAMSANGANDQYLNRQIISND